MPAGRRLLALPGNYFTLCIVSSVGGGLVTAAINSWRTPNATADPNINAGLMGGAPGLAAGVAGWLLDGRILSQADLLLASAAVAFLRGAVRRMIGGGNQVVAGVALGCLGQSDVENAIDVRNEP